MERFRSLAKRTDPKDYSTIMHVYFCNFATSKLCFYLPVSQTLGRDLDCHASTTKEGKDKRIKLRKCTGCIFKNRLKTGQVSRERRVQSGLQPD